MSTVIVDIETSPLPLSEAMLKYLLRDVDPCDADAHEEALGKAALSPLTGQVVCVGLLNPDTSLYRVYCNGGVLVDEIDRKGNIVTDWSAACWDEHDLLTHFWANAKRHDVLVTFNGRSFDLPFLLIRSTILGVQPSRTDLMGYRFADKPHCDLLEQMTYYGATNKFPIALACEAFGIKNPNESCDGSKVAELFNAGKHREIAEYNLADLRATAQLYKKWKGI